MWMHVEHDDLWFNLNLGTGYIQLPNASSVKKYTNIHHFQRVILEISILTCLKLF